MSIIITGLEMPKEGNWRSIRIYPDGTIGRPIGFGEYALDALVEGAKAVPVPQHGRLIDADALKEKWTHRDLDLFAQGWGYLQDINHAPTIIPAEEGER